MILAMKLSRTIRQWVPHVLGLYILAQIVGVALLAAVHFDHAYHSQVAIAEDIAQAGVVDHGHERNGHHQHDDRDPGDQCCTLHHHLAAVLSLEPAARRIDFKRILLTLPFHDLLVGAEPGLPDRPPKLPLSV